MFYVKVGGVTFEVYGTRTVPKTWKVSCEHAEFKALCIKCANMLARRINPKLSGKRYITNWEEIQFLS